MAITPITKQQAVATLMATGSSDADVLYARMQELICETKRSRRLATVQVLVGSALSVTLIGAIFGIPVAKRGVELRRRISENLATLRAAYAECLAGAPLHASTNRVSVEANK